MGRGTSDAGIRRRAVRRRLGTATAVALALLVPACAPAERSAPAVPSTSAPSPTRPVADPPGTTGPADTTGTSPPTTPPPTSPTPTTAPPTTTAPAAPGRVVVVTSITDGDTFRAGEERVRIIGIDTPEVAQGPECGGPEATLALEALIPVGTEVRLVADVEPTDRYDRTLAYVHRSADDLDVGLAMLADGRARPLEVAPNVARAGPYRAASDEARAAGRGVWGACPDPDAPPSTAAPATGGRGGCDPSYPDVCIQPSPPDLDCADVPHRRFRVLPPDPHRFDGGGDGIGCESG